MRSKAECAALIIQTMSDTWGPLVGIALRVRPITGHPDAEKSFKAFIAEGLSGKGEVARLFIDTGTSIGTAAPEIPALTKLGITGEELRQHGFVKPTPGFSFSDKGTWQILITEIVRATGLNDEPPKALAMTLHHASFLETPEGQDILANATGTASASTVPFNWLRQVFDQHGVSLTFRKKNGLHGEPAAIVTALRQVDGQLRKYTKLAVANKRKSKEEIVGTDNARKALQVLGLM